MNLVEKVTMQSFHEHRIKDFGKNSVRSLGWKNENSQQKRFEILLQLGDMNNCSILDVGCGHGDLKPFLDSHFSNITYIGVDQIPRFVALAKDRYGHLPNTHFVQGDFSKLYFPSIDFVIGSGVFGYKCDRENYYFETIKHMFQIANKGIGFNMLDEKLFPEHPLLRGHNREKTISFCKTITPKTKIIDDYLEDDFTLILGR